MTMSLPQYVGEAIPMGNVGSMRNSGVEMDFNYRQNFGDFSLRVNANCLSPQQAHSLRQRQGWANLDSSRALAPSPAPRTDSPSPSSTDTRPTVSQNQAEANAYNTKYGTSLVPGDVRYTDVNGDGAITEDDRTKIGKGMPDWTYGFGITATHGAASTSTPSSRALPVTTSSTLPAASTPLASNLPSWMLNRWTGEGTTNSLPRYVQADPYNWQSSDLMVYDGSYLRLKNIQLGYTLPENITRKVFVSKFRVYVAAENLATWTKYHGYDPEISSGGTSLGIDYGVYPRPACGLWVSTSLSNT